MDLYRFYEKVIILLGFSYHTIRFSFFSIVFEDFIISQSLTVIQKKEKMNKLIFTLSCLLLLTSFSHAQRLSEFSEVPAEYLKQLGEFMTSSKRKVMEESFRDYEKQFKAGVFNEEDFAIILKTSNMMLQQKMKAAPFFKSYLDCLTIIKKGGDMEAVANRFKDWHLVLESMLSDIRDRKLNPYRDFLKFSHTFFSQNVLRTSKSGVNWSARADKYEMRYEDKQPVIAYEKLDLISFRKTDTIVILGTTGHFLPVKQLWKGQGGVVNWARFGMAKKIYCELEDYEIEVKKSLYKVKKVTLHYPDLFPNEPITGSLQDKITTENKATGSSYPRFESDLKVLKIDNIGEGIKYVGGFRLHGTTVYGYGSKKNKARLTLFDKNQQTSFKGASELFVIRKGERIAAERLEMVLYLNQDSIYHPSVNIKFDILNREMELYRGKRGSDRNPFFNSLHQVNVDVDNLEWHMDTGEILLGKSAVSFANQSEVKFESFNFFEEGEFRRIQNIATTNPLYVIRYFVDEEGSNVISAKNLAAKINPRFEEENIQSLLYDLVAKGFINYDSDESLVEVKDKVFHYTDANAEKVDYDVLRIESKSDSTNALLNMNDNSIRTNGVRNVELSSTQKVALKPNGTELVIKENRDLDYDGKMFAGFTTFIGKDFHYIYEKHQVLLDSIRFFDMFVPTGEEDENGEKIAMSIGSRIEHAQGVLLVDAPNNRAGKEDIPIFPSFNSTGPSYIFYDDRNNRSYKRDSFYFQLDKFNFNALDDFEKEDLQFKGTMVSANIFPDFKEAVVLREEDSSLGFVSQTPPEGYPCYSEKGNYTGAIDLSNNGFRGKGSLKYLTASLASEDILFRPKQMTATADRFDLQEDRNSAVPFPQAVGYDVSIDWLPYKDSMYIYTKEKPFELFKANDHTVKGTLILTPGGLKATGEFNWEKGILTSRLMSFGANSVRADTANLQIKAFGANEFAFDTRNVNTNLDFDEFIGRITANSDELSTTMPYNQYQTSMNELYWNMKEETVVFKNEGKEYGEFRSIHPDQDSLSFLGKTAFYDLKTNELKIGGVPHIRTCDAFVYTEAGDVEIKKGGVMTTLENAQIVADTSNKYHVINKATVNVLGAKDYRAKGYYEYNIGDKQQEIYFENIIGTRVGKGKRSEKKTVTRAKGTVKEKDKFYIDHKTLFQGEIALSADSKNLEFDGFAHLDAPLAKGLEWFSIKSKADKNDLTIQYDKPKNLRGETVKTGFYLSKEQATIYPRVMMPTFLRKDRPIIDAKGVFKYKPKTDEFVFGDSLKVTTFERRGNKITYSVKDNSVKAEGSMNIGSGLDYISVKSAGIAESPLDGTQGNFKAEVMAGISMIIPEKLLKIMVTDIIASSYDARPVDYLKDIEFYEKVLSEFISKDKDLINAIKKMKNEGMDLSKKYDQFSFLFSKIPLKWNSEYQSFISSKDELALASVNGSRINRMLTSYVEFKMPSNEDDRVYIYIKSPSGFFYYFGFKQGIMSTVSSNTKFMDELLGMKEKELIVKMGDGEPYEIQAAEMGRANMFVNRVKTGR